MKKIAVCLTVLSLLLAGCANTQNETAETVEPVEEQAVEVVAEGKTILPLPDTTMENLTDATVHVSFEQEDVYVDDEGILQMDVTVYTYDRYDMVDMAMLEVGDILAGHDGEVVVTALERDDAGTVLINGGLEAGGFDLATEDNGVFFEVGYDDVRSWHEVGTATLRVSADMVGYDGSDLELGEVTFYPGDLLEGIVNNFHFVPHNTTVRIENGQIVEIYRRYTP